MKKRRIIKKGIQKRSKDNGKKKIEDAEGKKSKVRKNKNKKEVEKRRKII